MENRPEFVCIWLGLARLGVISALINTNLKAQALIHSIIVANSKVLIYGDELSEAVDAVRAEINAIMNIHYLVQNPQSKTSGKTDLNLESLFTNETSVKFNEPEQMNPKGEF